MNGSVPDTAQLTLAADNKQERRSKLLILRFGRDPQREELQRVKLGSRQAKLPTNRDELTGVWEAEDDFWSLTPRTRRRPMVLAPSWWMAS